jgi:hypothetical protein
MTIQIPSDIESRLAAEAERSGVDPAGFVQNLLRARLQAPIHPPSVSRQEAELLEAIDIGFSEAQMDRYVELIEKRRNGTIAQDELQELLETTSDLERLNVQRTGALSQLAELRGIDLGTAMQELGIEAPDVL